MTRNLDTHWKLHCVWLSRQGLGIWMSCMAWIELRSIGLSMIVTLERLAFTHLARVVWGYVCMDYIRVLEGMLRTCVLDHKSRGLVALSGTRLQQ